MGKGFPFGIGGGVDTDAVTAVAADVVAGKVIVDKDGNPITGTLPLNEVTAAAADVLASKIIVDKTGKKVTGTMTNRGAWASSNLAAGGSVTIPAGWHNGSGKVTANTLANQTAGNATAGYIYSGKTAWVAGNKITGTMTVNSITSFSAAANGGKKILLKWKNPSAATGKPYSGVIIRYSTSGYPGTGGTQIYKGAGNNTAAGAMSQVEVTMPAFNTTYYFTAIPYATCSAGEMTGAANNASAKTQTEQQLTFTASQKYTIPNGYTKADIFCVGGGAGIYANSSGTSDGAGSGLTKTVKNIDISSGQILDIVIGAGGNGTNGNDSYVTRNGTDLCRAKFGGYNEYRTNGTDHTNGGSGGGERNEANSDWGYYAGSGGSDGSNGYYSSDRGSTADKIYDNNSGNYIKNQGQHTNTRAYGNASGTLYAGGGGGGSGTNASKYYPGPGGAGGGGAGSENKGVSGANGSANTGGGAGGQTLNCPANKGGSGIVLIHLY